MFTSGYQELRKTWEQLRQTRRLKRFLLAFFVLNMGVQTVMYLAANFAKQEVKQLDASGAEVPISDASLIFSILIIQLVAIGGALIFVQLSKRFGNVRALMIAAVVWIGACVFAFTLHWTSQFYMLAGVVGLVMGGSQSLSRSTYAKFLPETDDHASYFSFYDVSYYVGTVLGTAAVWRGVRPHRRPALHRDGASVPFFVVGLLLLLRVPKEEVALPASCLMAIFAPDERPEDLGCDRSSAVASWVPPPCTSCRPVSPPNGSCSWKRNRTSPTTRPATTAA